MDIIIRELSNIPHNTSGIVTLVDVDSDEVAPNGTHEIFVFFFLFDSSKNTFSQFANS